MTVRHLAAAALMAVPLAFAAPLASAGPDDEAGERASVQRDIAAVRAATAKYHHEPLAVADGFHRTDACVSSPAGAMGFHYLNPERLQGALDVRRPQLLIYQPTSDGGRKLVAVEYLVVDADQDLTTDDDRPTLFDRPFNGPMEGHEPGMPIHYDLHVWVWQHNPAGMFEDWNPAGRC